MDTLKGCFECADWGVLLDELQDINHNVDAISANLYFCVNLVIPKRHVTVYFHNEPWVTKDVKSLSNQKTRALSGSTKAEVQSVQTLLNKCNNKTKYDYKCKIDVMSKTNNAKDA